ncbi:ADP-ribosyltransferase [Variovorax paradoxus]
MLTNYHAEFLAHLKGIANAGEVIEACRKYKTNEDNFASHVNGRLKGGLAMDHYLNDFLLLRSAIRATFTQPMTLYRLTSDLEFSAPAARVLNGRFPYQAFMSTADSPTKLNSFKQSGGRPLLLEIECPAGIALAPFDLFAGTEEDEILLGCGTTFEVKSGPRELNANEISGHIPMYDRQSLDLLQLKVVESPAYVDLANLVSLESSL